MSSYQENPYQVFNAYGTAEYAAVDVRAAFIRRTYVHLALAVAAFVGLCYLWLQLPITYELLDVMARTPFSWLIVLGAFMLVSFVADKWASSATSPATQYAGLGLYVVAESIIFVPLVLGALMMEARSGQPILMPAGVMTVAVFGAMTAIVFITARDFSFLRSTLSVAGLVAMGLIVLSIFMGGGFTYSYIFIGAMLVFCCGYVLYYTSNVMHHYRTDQHVSAALALFASLALLLWYMIQLFMRARE